MAFRLKPAGLSNRKRVEVGASLPTLQANKMNCKWYNICPLRRFERQGKLSNKWAETYCKSDENWKNCKRYQLEERGIYHPDNMLPNGEIDETIDAYAAGQ